MPKISLEVPTELLTDLDGHVGPDARYVNRSEAVRSAMRCHLNELPDRDDRGEGGDSEP